MCGRGCGGCWPNVSSAGDVGWMKRLEIHKRRCSRPQEDLCSTGGGLLGLLRLLLLQRRKLLLRMRPLPEAVIRCK